MPFFLIFIIIPMIELFLFATVSQEIGIWTTVALAFATAIIGGNLVRLQGIQTLFSLRGTVEQGQMPLDEIFDGACIVAAGALLITPGFLTDTIGFTLLIPPVRALARQAIRKHTTWSVNASGFTGGHSPNRPQDPNIIEGDYIEIDPDDVSEDSSKDDKIK